MADTPIDRSGQKLLIYNKDGNKVATGPAGEEKAILEGLAAGTEVKAGDYYVTFSDGRKDSPGTPVPAFNVPAAIPAPTDIAAAPTKDGATISAK